MQETFLLEPNNLCVDSINSQSRHDLMTQVPKSHKTGIFTPQVLIFTALGFQQFNIYNEKLPIFFFLVET